MILEVGMLLRIRDKKLLLERPYLGDGLFRVRFIGSKLICARPTLNGEPEATFELNLTDLQYCTRARSAVSRK